VGKNLRDAREARGLTAIALSELVGVTKGAMSQYETGKQSPTPVVMRAICEVLNLPLQFFLRPAGEQSFGPIFYRSMCSATKGARIRAERQYSWLKAIVAFLAKHVHLVAPAFPVPRVGDPLRLSLSDVELIAKEVRDFWELGAGPISNVTWLLENKGALVARFELGEDKLDAFSEWSTSYGRPFIVLNADKDSAARSRFDAAHELGHIVLHRDLGSVSSSNFKLLEDQAHRFALAFLLPAESFSDHLYSPSLESFRCAKEQWGVSIAAMIKRSGQLGLLSDSAERRLWIGLARRGWKTREPLDDTLPCEKPSFLRKSLELVMAGGRVHPRDFSTQIGLYAQDVERLVGLDRNSLDREAALRIELSDESDIEEHVIRFPFVE